MEAFDWFLVLAAISYCAIHFFTHRDELAAARERGKQNVKTSDNSEETP